jgi:hypothetical protein
MPAVPRQTLVLAKTQATALIVSDDAKNFQSNLQRIL